ncbi:MAG: Hsp20 family protein [Clostridium sp.]
MENSLIIHKNAISESFNQEKNISILSNISVNDVMIWVLESDDSILVQGILPDVDQKDLKIDYKNGDLIINVTQNIVKESSGIGFISFMSSSSSFSRNIHVGEVDIPSLKFEYINNKLSLYIPKLRIVETTFQEIE